MPFDAEKKLDHKQDELLGKDKLFCAACGHWITSGDWKISIKDGHEHTVFNPAGRVFNIGCFRDAPGCIEAGTPSGDFTWFPNYKWQIAFCEGCGTHLGWFFTGIGPVPTFHGLILNRMTNKPSN